MAALRPILEFWLSLSRLNRFALDFLLFWLAAGTVLSLGALGNRAVREFVPPFLALTVLAGVVGTLIAVLESVRRVLGQARLPQDRFDERQRNGRNLRVAVLLAAANAFPGFVLGLAWLRGILFFD